MPTLPHWNLSQQSRARMIDLLKSAADLGLDPDAVAGGGLAALQALIALKRAKDAGDGATRDALLARTQEALRGLDPSTQGALLQQMQTRIPALQGRGGDTEVAHVTPGEIVLTKALQTPAVLGALHQAAADADIPLDQLRVGAGANKVNPQTGAPEFAEEAIPEIHINAVRPSQENINLLARMIYGEAAGQNSVDGLYQHLGWAAVNRVAAPTFPSTLNEVIFQKNQFDSVGKPLWNDFDKPGQMNPLSQAARDKALEVASGILNGDIPDPSQGAQYFYTGKPPKRFQEHLDTGRFERIEKDFQPHFEFLRDVLRRK